MQKSQKMAQTKTVLKHKAANLKKNSIFSVIYFAYLSQGHRIKKKDFKHVAPNLP